MDGAQMKQSREQGRKNCAHGVDIVEVVSCGLDSHCYQLPGASCKPSLTRGGCRRSCRLRYWEMYHCTATATPPETSSPRPIPSTTHPMRRTAATIWGEGWHRCRQWSWCLVSRVIDTVPSMHLPSTCAPFTGAPHTTSHNRSWPTLVFSAATNCTPSHLQPPIQRGGACPLRRRSCRATTHLTILTKSPNHTQHPTTFRRGPTPRRHRRGCPRLPGGPSHH